MSTLVRRLFWLLAIALAGGAGYQWWRRRQIPSRPEAPEWPPIHVDAGPAQATTVDEADAGDAGDASGDDTDEADARDPGDASGDDTDEADTTDPGDASGDDTDEAGPIVRRPTDDAPTGASSVVNALVDAPEARSTAGDGAPWIEPAPDGSCPLSHPIKANDNSGIFHVPDGRFYERTKAERCYADADAALADGYRQAKS